VSSVTVVSVGMGDLKGDLRQILQGFLHGFLYGAKSTRTNVLWSWIKIYAVRFPHALLMVSLFDKKDLSWDRKIDKILSLTLNHARNLGLFVLTYKSLVAGLRKTNMRKGVAVALAGGLGGSLVFGDDTSINTQVKFAVIREAFSEGLSIDQPLCLLASSESSWTPYTGEAMDT